MIATPASDAARKLRVAFHHGGKTAARTAPSGAGGRGASVSMASASVLTASNNDAFAATGQGRARRAEELVRERNMLQF